MPQVHLHPGKAHRDPFLGPSAVLFRIFRLGRIRIDANLIPPLPAQHLVHGNVVNLARQVPQRHLHRAHSARLPGDAAELLNFLKEKVDLQRVLAHQPVLEQHGVLIPGAIAHFTQSINPLVGIDADDGAGAGPRLDDDGITHVGDFQRRGAGVSVDVLHRRLGRVGRLFQAVTAEKTAAHDAHRRLKDATAIEFPFRKIWHGYVSSLVHTRTVHLLVG
jgi:hypothetical protein